MVINWSMSNDELYGPPPAYSVDPPPSIYTIPETRHEYQERSSSSHTMMILSLNFIRFLLGTGLLHLFIGITAIVCDILLISMNESYLFTGLWAGVSCIILGIYLILFMSYPEKQKCSFYRFKFIHIAVCLIIILALILSSINLASNFCYSTYFELDQCQNSAQKLKIILVTFFTFTFVQICINFLVTFIHTNSR